MDFDTVARERRSVRGFLRERQVPPETLQAALEVAQRAPSNCNVQPWRVFIASGARRDRLSARLIAAAQERGGAVQVSEQFAGDYRKRQVECAVELYGQMGIARDDIAGRKAAFLRNYAFFDAPHVAFVCMDKSFGLSVAVDVGMYVQTLVLALWARGVQSCAQVSLCRFEEVTRHELGIPDDLRILCGVSFGYEDVGVAANRTRQARQPAAANVTLLSD
jgi:nitroreductase